jgi:hypothetical protein
MAQLPCGASFRVHKGENGMSQIRTTYGAALHADDGAFDPEQLMKVAEAATGLADWGGERWQEGRFRQRLSAFCGDLEGAAALTSRGRSRAHSRLHVLLCTRLRQVHRRAGRAAQVLPAPLIGMGLPRAGTTFLHGLLSADPDHLVATAAQAAIPLPAPGSGEVDETERIRLYEDILTFQGFTAPDVTEIHPYSAHLPEECVFMQEQVCASPLGAFYFAPTFGALCVDPDHIDDGYAWQHGMMATLQEGRAAVRWLLKAPLHIARMDALHKYFPDARIFFNHRDPGKVIPSMASLYMKLYSLASDSSVDPLALGPQLVGNWKRMLDNFDLWREAHPSVPIVDVQYAELTADPLGAAERIYAAFGLAMTPAIRLAMESHLALDGHGKAPARQYGLAEFGLVEDDIEAAFSGYIERNNVQRERRR